MATAKEMAAFEADQRHLEFPNLKALTSVIAPQLEARDQLLLEDMAMSAHKEPDGRLNWALRDWKDRLVWIRTYGAGNPPTLTYLASEWGDAHPGRPSEIEERMHQALKSAWPLVNKLWTSQSAKTEVGHFAQAEQVAGRMVDMQFALQTAWPFVHGEGADELKDEMRALLRHGGQFSSSEDDDEDDWYVFDGAPQNSAPKAEDRLRYYLDDACLLLEKVEFDQMGKIAAGYVVNGHWWLRRNETEGRWEALQSTGDGPLVNCWSIRPEADRFVAIPAAIKGDYNELIAWAKKQLPPLAPKPDEAQDESTEVVPRQRSSLRM